MLYLRENSQQCAAQDRATHYCWASSEGVLSVMLETGDTPRSVPAAVAELSGTSGGWILLELAADGSLLSVEITAWPRIELTAALVVPKCAITFALLQSAVSPAGRVADDEEIRLSADLRRGVLRFRFGQRKATTFYRASEGVLLGSCSSGKLTELWLCGVPPMPAIEMVPPD